MSEESELLKSRKAFARATTETQQKGFALANFELGRTLGKGRYARVRYAKLRGHDDVRLCLKILKKEEVIALEQVEHVMNEKAVLASVNHPFVIQLLDTFQDQRCLYMAIELVNCGELFTLLRSMERFPKNLARFYCAEVSCAIQHLHEMLVVFRDLKPENILIDWTGHLKVTDFGFAKYMKEAKTHTVCGTAAYMAPEIIRKKGHSLPVDWWGVGVLLFEMLTGQVPFRGGEDAEIFSAILSGRISYPADMDKNAKDAIARFLNPDPNRRLGNLEAPGVKLRDHAFFKELNFDDLEAGKIPPPWRPGDGEEKSMENDLSRFGEYDESDVVANAPYTPNGDPFESWSSRNNFREEALNLAQQLRDAREKKRAELKQAQDEEQRRLDELQMEEDRKLATDKTKDTTAKPMLNSKKTEDAEKEKPCCSCSVS